MKIKWESHSKIEGENVFGDVVVLDDITINDKATITGDIVIAGDFSLGISGTGSDFTVWGDVASYKVWFDADGDTNGAWYFGADTKGILTKWFGDTTGFYVQFDPSGDTDGAFYFGANTKGIDVLAYGATTGNYLHWDKSADDLLLVGTATQLAVAGDTDSSSVTTGSLRTAGGLGVVKTLYVGTGADITGNLDVNGTTVVLDGSTSVRGISAGFVSLESPANRFGSDASFYMQIATTTTTGVTAITHTGSGPAITWTADSLSFVGDFDSNGATAVLDGSTSVRLISAGFTSLESPANRFGLNATEYIQIATTVTTGATAITHTGSGPDVTWTADSLAFTGDLSSEG